MSELRLSNAPDVSLAERLAFERLLGDLSAHCADLPADRVVDKIAGARRPLIDFLGFDRWGFGEVVGAGGQFLVRCSGPATASIPHRSARPRRCPGISASCGPELQIKLLRVLHDGGFERVGSTRTIQVRVRAIAATNRDLARAVPEVRFREDLYYRLNVFPVVVPPLRERPENIPLLAWQFVQELGESMGKPIEHVADDSMAALLAYPWPENVRELRNLIERAMILARGPTLQYFPQRRWARTFMTTAELEYPKCNFSATVGFAPA